MADLVGFLDSRRPSGVSKRDFAQKLGISTAAIDLYAKDQRGMKVKTLRRMAEYFKSINDQEALSVLASYAVGVPGYFTPSN